MAKIKLSSIELAELNKRRKKEKDKKIYNRLQCIYLVHIGKKHKEIIDILSVNKNSVTDWVKIYSDKGIDELSRPINYDRRSSKIDKYIDKIKQDVKDNMISTLAELQDWISEKYSIEIEKSWLFRYCKKNSICLTRKHA